MGAPSISSMIRQLGFSSAPSTDFIWVAASMRVLKTSGLRSSLQEKATGGGSARHHHQWLLGPGRGEAHLAFISTTLYPACFAMTWASVVFPRPGGPQSRATCGTEGTFSPCKPLHWHLEGHHEQGRSLREGEWNRSSWRQQSPMVSNWTSHAFCKFIG